MDKSMIAWFTTDVIVAALFVYIGMHCDPPTPMKVMGSEVNCNCQVTWPFHNNPNKAIKAL